VPVDTCGQPVAKPVEFVLIPKGQVQIVDRSNAPFARPGLRLLLDGIRFVTDKACPGSRHRLNLAYTTFSVNACACGTVCLNDGRCSMRSV